MLGVSEVIAIILILMITIAIAGLAYTFMSSTMASTTSAASSAVESTTSSMLTSFTIESVDENIIYIRNTGSSALSSLSVYVNELPVRVNITPSSIATGAVGMIAINDYVKTGDMIKIAYQNGFSASKTAPDQCYGAIACWRFDEGFGSTVNDSSGNGNDGSLVNMNIIGNSTSGWTTGRFGGGLLFDGINDYVSAGSCSSRPSLCFSSYEELTISAWLYPLATQAAGSQTIIHNGFYWQGSQGIYFREGSGGSDVPSFFVGNGTSWHAPSSSVAVSHNVWSHIVGTVKIGGNVSVYVNGILRGTQPFMGRFNQTNANLIIGYEAPTGNFNGIIDEIAVWNRELTAEEISMLYNKAIY